jgi:hypothetical protein
MPALFTIPNQKLKLLVMDEGRIPHPTRPCRRRDETGQHGPLAILRQSDQDQSGNRTHQFVDPSSGHEWQLIVVS